MYTWYQRAYICYAFLADIRIDPENRNHRALCTKRVGSSRWFDRGWTLQELLAPAQVIFFDMDWQYMGAKHSPGYPHFSWAIESRTSIPLEALCDNSALQRRYSVAQRMAWASRRETTRIEDLAYCLLGLFDINMPLLYGEGRKAFARLQREILRQQQDESIFATAWTMSSHLDNSVFARSLSEFERAMDVVETRSDTGPLFSSVGDGLQLRVPAHPQKLVYRHKRQRELLVLLRCGRPKQMRFSPEIRLSTCIMHLTYHEQGCGHFFRRGPTETYLKEGHRRAPEQGLIDENDVQDWDSWRPVEAAGSLYIHANDTDISRCAKLRGRPRLLPPPVNNPAQHAADDALELNIQ